MGLVFSCFTHPSSLLHKPFAILNNFAYYGIPIEVLAPEGANTPVL
jgi:hypothetical protein